MDSNKLLKACEVAKRLDVHPRTLRRMVKDGRFPPPIVHVGLGTKRVDGRWDQRTIDDWKHGRL